MSSLFKMLADEDLKFEKMSGGGPVNAPKMTGLKIAIIVSFALSIVALAGAGFLRNSLESERKQRETLEASQTQLQQKAEAFEKAAAQYRGEIEKVQSQLKAYADEKAGLQKQLDASRAQIGTLEKNIKDIQEKNKAMEEASKNAEPQQDVAATAASGFSAVGAAAVTAAAKTQPAAAKPSAPAQAPAPAEKKPPQVLTVNRKFNFVVVNIGLQQKLKIGDVLEVVRNGKPAARLQVEKLYASFSAASITQEPKDAPVKEGDLIRAV